MSIDLSSGLDSPKKQTARVKRTYQPGGLLPKEASLLLSAEADRLVPTLVIAPAFNPPKEASMPVAIIVNPGTEPLGTSSLKAAKQSMETFVADLPESASFVRAPKLDYNKEYKDDRYAFILTYKGIEREIQMPGWPPERVRFRGEDGQNIWDYPRLYVDGSSWVWKYALNMVEPEDEDEGE